MQSQITIEYPVDVSGIGIHQGRETHLRMLPAAPDSGIRFVRVDLDGRPEVRVCPQAMRSTEGASVLAGDGFVVVTVEHCLAAVAGFGIDNLTIELDGDEPPTGDGSARVYARALRQAGRVEQPAEKRHIVVRERIFHGDDARHAYVEPHDGLRLTCTIDFAHPVIGRQSLALDIDEETFAHELADARTFGFLKDRERHRAIGVGKGAVFANTIVLDDARVLNAEGLRYADEFVRHKLLDGLGDIAALGGRLRGHLVMHRSGHDVMRGLVQKIAEALTPSPA
ncbi:MAG: UDP-3-O-acyl-N-acetylglucosamine deacetylase [Gammaproteobacteria bacterium]|nr:UDP-3-O-acyl-N-acetylglucosamine deacetylase [Gammaproteobacteria bacterium]